MTNCPYGTVKHVIKEKDTVYKLANIYNITAQEILRANPGLDIKRLNIGQILCIPQKPHMPPSGGQYCVNKKQQDLINTLRTLWEQHVAWTRMTIQAIKSNSPFLSMIASRLLRNAADMAKALTPIYGEEKAKKIGELIKSHLQIAYQLVSAANKGDADAAAKAEKAWYENASDIASYLSAINPNWNYNALKSMLIMHLDLTKQEALGILENEMNKSIDLYDRIEQQVLMMADALADGIIKQFPAMFR